MLVWERTKKVLLATTSKIVQNPINLKLSWNLLWHLSYNFLKIWLMCSLVTSIFLYACEPWTLTAELQRRIQLTSHGNEVLPQDTTHLIQRPCYQWGSRQSDHTKTSWPRKEMQTAVVWSCFPFIRSGQNHLARHNEREKKTRQMEEGMGRQHQGIDTVSYTHLTLPTKLSV